MESKANTKQKDNMQENNQFNNDKIYKNIKLPLKSLALFIFIMSGGTKCLKSKSLIATKMNG